MDIQQNQDNKTEIMLTITVLPDEYQQDLKKTAQEIAKTTKIEGFREGKAPYELIKNKVGKNQIFNQASNNIINRTLFDAIQQKKIQAVSNPQIDIKKVAFGEPFVYTAKLSLMPEIKLAELSQITVKSPTIKIEPKEVDQLINRLAKSRAKQTKVDRAAQVNDLIKLDYNIKIDNVPQEDGQQKDFEVYLGEKHMIPGFEEQITGLKAGDDKSFELKFPDDYFQKNYAGRKVKFEVKIKEVYQVQLPQIDDEFAKNLGQFGDLAELKKQLQQNLHQEKEQKKERELEQEILDKIIEASQSDEIPTIMIDNEVKNIIQEFEQDLAQRGLELETWLQNINKNHQQFEKDLRPQAEKRVKAALIIRKITEQQNIRINPKQVDEELDKLKQSYKDNQQVIQQINSRSYKEHLTNILTANQTMQWLKDKILKK